MFPPPNKTSSSKGGVATWLIGGKARLMSVPGLEDLGPEEDARRARAREVYAKMYPLSTDDPYGEKRLERVQTPTGIKRVFNQVAREMGLGAYIDGQESEQSRRLEPREVDRNAYCAPVSRERCPRDPPSRRRPGWVTCRFVLPDGMHDA